MHQSLIAIVLKVIIVVDCDSNNTKYQRLHKSGFEGRNFEIEAREAELFFEARFLLEKFFIRSLVQLSHYYILSILGKLGAAFLNTKSFVQKVV